MTAGVADGGGVLDPGGAMDRIAAWRGQIDKLAADTKTMSDRMQELRVSATDPNGLVEVTVDSTGGLVDLRLGQRIQRVDPDIVARTIMATIQEAKGVLAGRAQEILAETIGTDSPAGRAIAERVGQQLRGPEQDPGHFGGWER
ncbi:YbaB/EbfC family nucleoid-associated protein [Dactylosporangium sp. NPDC049525]|uniref:YbaB/EbfC family nucleoid-associated protein n=1 Tax=Dactylosporangium sp. NPDC049525 TaxID=3154730 RepID=UPI00343DAEEC